MTQMEAKLFLDKLLLGCSNHGCVVKPPTGQGLNAGCQCNIKIRDLLRPLKSQLAERNKRVKELESENEQLKKKVKELLPGFKDVIGIFKREDIDERVKVLEEADKEKLKIIKEIRKLTICNTLAGDNNSTGWDRLISIRQWCDPVLFLAEAAKAALPEKGAGDD